MRIQTLFILALLPLLGSAQSVRKFPADFKFCVSTAAHQIEGNNTHSDWWAWEKLPGKIKNGDRSGLADDHWNRILEDIAWMKWLGVKRYRFSIEWARIEPRQGKWNYAALAHYVFEIEALKVAGIEPMITLHHFTLPKWFQDGGGWMRKDAPLLFEHYVDFVVRELSDNGVEVRDWITFNEPMVTIAAGYLAGVVPPERKDLLSLKAEPVLQLLRAHARAYHRIHDIADANGQTVRVGMAHHLRAFKAARWWNPLDHAAAKALERVTNWAIPEALETGRYKFRIPFTLHVNEKIEDLAGTQDFVGVNYYTRDVVRFTGNGAMPIEVSVMPGSETTDLGWEIYPEGFGYVLRESAKRYPGKPIVITENGIADASDSKRSEFLRTHLDQVLNAIKDGAPVEGYCHWSLLDNFEWIEGFTPRFGLLEVDYKTFKRTPRKSAELFREFTTSLGR